MKMDPKAIAASTMTALERGYYTAPDGTQVNIAPLRDVCVSSTRAYLPEALVALREEVIHRPHTPLVTTCAVNNETTLRGCARLTHSISGWAR
jgi:hypothetical protein